MKIFFLYILLAALSFQNHSNSQGKVYLVLGSDTAIWDGMSVSRYNCTYNLDLFTDVQKNTYKVMQSAFRDQIVDSYGNKLKMTWWMMGGNIFRFATNNNVPLNNTMTIHLMKKNFSDKIDLWGDELSLHYHTFHWTDYNQDGVYWWNQALNFTETRNDFDITLAQYLIEEETFPISFRSGWHYMDNEWQNYLNDLLPYSLHNDWPSKRTDLTEPLDNTFDWSLASSEFVPFRPHENNYQLPGGDKGWNVRSEYMGSVTQQLMSDVFNKANQGVDQVVCLWSHLPDQNFLTEIQSANNIIHQTAANYPQVMFKYCTAIEAMQLWRGTNDFTAPELTVEENISGTNVSFTITSSEPIFQKQPIVAIKDKNENYILAQCQNVSQNVWRTIESFPLNNIAKVTVAITDTLGNQSIQKINFLPDDIFIDNNDPAYQELSGVWTSSNLSAWGLDSRTTTLTENDSAKVRWNINVPQSGYYNIFTQVPQAANPANKISFYTYVNNIIVDSLKTNEPIEPYKWKFINTVYLESSDNTIIEMVANGTNQVNKILTADAIKISALVRDKQLFPEKQFLNLGEVSIEDTLLINLKLSNIGINDLNVFNVYSLGNQISPQSSLPLTISGMSNVTVQILFTPNALGVIVDTLIIESDDPSFPQYRIPISAFGENFFKVVDNADSLNYSELGNWQNSVAFAHGSSSRFVFLNRPTGGSYANFSATLSKDGIYDIFQIVPTTVNSSNYALYEISVTSSVLDSVYVNQNTNSGYWNLIGRYHLPAMTQINVKVIDTGLSSSGDVLRADAIKFLLIDELTDTDEFNLIQVSDYSLEQNFPNPFNPSTIIRYTIPTPPISSPLAKGRTEEGFITLKVYDVLGNEVATLVDEFKPAGIYEVEFNVTQSANGGSSPALTSGVYFYQLRAGDFSETKKMILIK